MFRVLPASSTGLLNRISRGLSTFGVKGAATLLLCLSTLIFLSLLPQSQAQPPTARPLPNVPGLTHVVLISLDGARPDAILQANTPHMLALAARGAVSWTAKTVLPPVTLPAHASMLTGLDVGAHGVNWNVFSVGVLNAETPTFLLAAHEAGYRTALVVGKEKLALFRQSDGIDFTFARQGDRSVVDRALELLRDGYEVLFLHLPNPDYFGHRDGWMGETYLFELGNTDAQIGRVLSALDEVGLADETLVILTADHGGHDRLHGQDIPEDRTIPWIIAGPGVAPGSTLDSVRVADTAATILWALGLPVPEGTAGQPAYSAFRLRDNVVQQQ